MQRVLIAVIALGLAGCGSAAVRSASDNPSTVTVGTRDLATEHAVTGRVRRASEWTVTYLAPTSAAPPTSAAAPATTTTTVPTTTGSTTPAGGAQPQPQPANQQATPSEPAQPIASAAPAEAASDDRDILTSVVAPGSRVDNGTVVFTIDTEPVVAVVGSQPVWRDLDRSADDGADVRQLEEALVALGYGADLTVDDEYDGATTSAVEDWETALGRIDPDGVVQLGEIVAIDAPGEVLATAVTIGDEVNGGAPVLTIGSDAQIVTADVDLADVAAWAPGAEVTLESEGVAAGAGAVASVGRDVDGGEVTVTIVPDASLTLPNGSRVAAVVPDQRRQDVLSVPVAAVVEGESGSAAVRVLRGGTESFRPVVLGLVADGWVEIVSGLDGGEAIRVPG